MDKDWIILGERGMVKMKNNNESKVCVRCKHFKDLWYRVGYCSINKNDKKLKYWGETCRGFEINER